MLDKLAIISFNDLKKLRDLYLKDWPENFHGYYTLDNYVRWMKADSKIQNLKCYSLNGDWSDGTFIILDRYILLVNSLSDSHERLRRALTLLDWTKGFEIAGLQEKHRAAVLEAINIKGVEIEPEEMTYSYFLGKDQGKQLKIKPIDGVTVKQLTLNDIKMANEYWLHRDEGSYEFLRRLQKYNITLGAYDSETNELMSWCFRSQGPLSILVTRPEHTRKGLGKLIMQTFVKSLSECNEDSYCFIAPDNIPSRRLFEGLGFRLTGVNYWIFTKSVGNKNRFQI